jgi:Pyridoxamine 5'-phosphate oxidase
VEETRDEDGRRPLTDRERTELLDLPLAGIYSTLTIDERIHSVPVHYLPVGAELRILTEPESVKCRNSRRTGRATFCVETTFGGTDRRYVSAEGPVSIEHPVSLEDLTALHLRYGYDTEELDPTQYENSVMLVLRPEQWIAWSDAD